MFICINLIEYAPYLYICCPYCDGKENKYLIWFDLIWFDLNWSSVRWGKKYFVLGRLEQPRQDTNLLYILDEPKESVKEGSLSFVLVESPFASVFNSQQGLPLSSCSRRLGRTHIQRQQKTRYSLFILVLRYVHLYRSRYSMCVWGVWDIGKEMYNTEGSVRKYVYRRLNAIKIKWPLINLVAHPSDTILILSIIL
jgi:hypothetical protein